MKPSDFSMSASSFDENIAAGRAVATLSTSDPDSGDTHTYALVSGDGDADNSAFAIEGDQLELLNCLIMKLKIPTLFRYRVRILMAEPREVFSLDSKRSG